MKEKLDEETQADLAAIVAAFDDVIGDPVLPRPDGFGVTVREYADAKRVGEDTARRHLNNAVKDGKLARQLFTGTRGTPGYVYYLPESKPDV